MVFSWKKSFLLRNEKDILNLNYNQNYIVYENQLYLGFKVPFKDDGTSHYYSLGDEKNHIHLYRRLRTGNSRVKEFDFTESALLYSRKFGNNSIKDYTDFLLILRPYLKLSNIFSFYRYLKERKQLLFDSSIAFKNLENINEEKKFFFNNILQHKIKFQELKHNDKNLLKEIFYSIRISKIINKKYLVVKNTSIKIIMELFLQVIRKILLMKKKPLTNGMIVSITGPDGAGKSTIIKEFKRIGSGKSFIFFHFGMPNFTPLDHLKNKIVSNKNIKNYDKNYKKKRSNFITKLYRLDLAIRRMIITNVAIFYRKLGYIIVFDRYFNQNNSVLIDGCSLKNDGKLWHTFENFFYKLIPACDLEFNLCPKLDVVIKRNNLRNKLNKEDTKLIIKRFKESSSIKVKSNKTITIDTSNKMINETFELIVKKIWKIK